MQRRALGLKDKLKFRVLPVPVCLFGAMMRCLMMQIMRSDPLEVEERVNAHREVFWDDDR